MILEIWNSFRRLPLWVQIWMLLILVPTNLASVAFYTSYGGEWVVALSCLGMALNVPILFKDRGMSKLLALPHVVLWTPLVLFAIWILRSKGGISDDYVAYLKILIVVNVISLVFDYVDLVKWLRGDRAIV